MAVEREVDAEVFLRDFIKLKHDVTLVRFNDAQQSVEPILQVLDEAISESANRPVHS